MPSGSFVRVSLLCAVAMLLAGAGLQSSLLSIRGGIENFPVAAIGLVMSAYYAGYIVGSQVCGPLIYRVGHIRAFAALAAVASAVPLLHGLFVDAVAWILLRAVSGFCFFGLFMIMESWINGRTTNADRGTWLAIYMKVNLGAQAVGQTLLNVAPPTEIALFVLCAVLISNALVPVALTRSIPPKVPSDAGRLRLGALIRISPLGVAGCFASGLVISAFAGLGPLMATEIGFSTAMVSLFMSLVILGGAVLQWPVGRLSDVIDRRLALAVVSLVAAAMSATMALVVDRGSNSLFALGFVFGGAIYPIYSLSVAHTNDFMRDHDLIAASSGLLLSFGFGAVLGPYVAAWMIKALGPAGLFVHVAAVAVSLGLFAILRIGSRATVPIADRDRFVLVPETTPVAEALDPRTGQQKAAQRARHI